jgi:hypothetical protein
MLDEPDVDLRDRRLGEHAACRNGERNQVDVEAPRALQDQPLRLVEPEEVGHEAER